MGVRSPGFLKNVYMCMQLEGENQTDTAALVRRDRDQLHSPPVQSSSCKQHHQQLDHSAQEKIAASAASVRPTPPPLVHPFNPCNPDFTENRTRSEFCLEYYK